MEYLSRVLKALIKNKDFYFHPKCHRVGITHVMFADDLVIFSSGRDSSIKAVKAAVEEFLSCSGLGVNAQKSQIFVGGMGEEKRAWVEGILGCPISPLPVKYLGIALNNKSLRAHECSEITDKITRRMKLWSNKFLSRAGRRTLIMSVIQTMVYYWARICVLPRKVISAVNALCANFLWRGYNEKKGGHLVKWEDVTREKIEGGLGIKNLSIMNDAMVLNQLWSLEKGRGNLWNEWIKAYWTKNRSWWDDREMNNNSWVLKRMGYCKKLSAKCIASVENSVKWIGKGNGFNVRDTYYTLKDNHPLVDWHAIVWNCFNSPRDAFHAWLVARNRLLTKDRLQKMSMQVSQECVLCDEELETRDHLFFRCKGTKGVLSAILNFLNMVCPAHEWHLLIPWFNKLKQERLKTKIVAAGITMVMSEIWRRRNNKIFNNEEVHDSIIITKVVWALKMKIGAVEIAKIHREDREWLKSIGIE